MGAEYLGLHAPSRRLILQAIVRSAQGSLVAALAPGLIAADDNSVKPSVASAKPATAGVLATLSPEDDAFLDELEKANSLYIAVYERQEEIKHRFGNAGIEAITEADDLDERMP